MEFFNLLVKLKMAGTLSAKHACILAFWAKGVGMTGVGASLALSPRRTGGYFSTHFDETVGVQMAPSSFYSLAVPGHDTCTASRTDIPYAAVLPHEALEEELAQDPGILQTVASGRVHAEWGSLSTPTMRW